VAIEDAQLQTATLRRGATAGRWLAAASCLLVSDSAS
jgi:hypothetical protein